MLALLGVAVAVVALIALQRPAGRQASRATATVTAPPIASSRASATRSSSSRPPATSHSPTPPATARALSVIVLNNSAPAGAETIAKQQIERAGWPVTSTGTLDNQILSTCVYYDPANPASLAAAQQLQQKYPAIKRVAPKFAGLPAGPLVVVLTSDFTG
jgi:LytR cell envelope-related transcriptional attenuator